MPQPKRVQSALLGTQGLFDGLTDPSVPQQTLAGGGRLVVAFLDPGPLPDLGTQLHRRLEVVHEQPHVLVQPGQALTRRQPRETLVADEAADDGAVLLLDPGLVVLVIRPRARELPLLLLAVRLERLIDEGAVVSESIPLMGTGNWRRSTSRPSTTRDCSRATRATASVQPVQMSVATRLHRKTPCMEVPPWETKSISR